MNMREFWANEAAMMRDKSGVLGKEVLMPVISPTFGNTLQSVEQCSKTWDITSVWQVRSLELEKHDADTESAWNLVKKKYFIAKGEAEQTLKDVGARIPAQQKEIVSQLLNSNPWSYTIQSINNGNFNWREYALDYAKHITLENEHQQLIANLSSNDLRGFNEGMREFKSELRKFIDKLKKYVDENKNDIGYNRFNQYYEGEPLKVILDKIPLIKFTTAEIKALNMQETGDFTNITIDGFKFKKDGLRVNIKSSGEGIMGLCQLPIGSARDAIRWASSDKRITLLGDPDSKDLDKKMLEYETSICLSAAYIGYIVSKLQSELNQVSDCMDKKRMVFAGYNSGPFTVKYAMTAFFADSKGENLTWSNTKFQECLKKETRAFSLDKYAETKKYPTKIEERLTFKK